MRKLMLREGKYLAERSQSEQMQSRDCFSRASPAVSLLPQPLQASEKSR